MAFKNQCMDVFNILVERDELRDSELKDRSEDYSK